MRVGWQKWLLVFIGGIALLATSAMQIRSSSDSVPARIFCNAVLSRHCHTLPCRCCKHKSGCCICSVRLLFTEESGKNRSGIMPLKTVFWGDYEIIWNNPYFRILYYHEKWQFEQNEREKPHGCRGSPIYFIL